jgi:4-diphosphocytidyl-2-C-methyl-D-erythritol kinase
LRVIGRRADGFHLLAAEMVTLDLADELEFVTADEPRIEVLDAIAWTPANAPRPALAVPDDRTNLVLRALDLAAAPAAVRLIKHIPPGAGLGGGSADAAAALRFAGTEDRAIALRLGADVPFCLLGGRAAVGGIGEELTPLDYVEQTFVVLSPALIVETPRVYAAYDELGPGTVDPAAPNDLEHAALAVEPRLASYRALFDAAADARPVLAGSGASYFVPCDPSVADELAARTTRRLVADGLRALVTVARAVPAVPTGAR